MRDDQPLTFAKAFARLEEVASALEEPSLELEKAGRLVEEARRLEKFCREQLKGEKAKVTKLFGKQ